MSDELRRDAAGFRLRGLATTRIETFTDAAFAFALTLLVISASLGPGSTIDALTDALREIPAFIISGALIMMFWWGHHEWSRRYGMDDGLTLILSCLLVFTVLVYVFPLRFMASGMVAYFSGLAGIDPGSTRVAISRASDVNRMFAIYGVGFSAMSLSIVLLNLHAWRNRDVLELDAIERHETRATIGAWFIVMMAGVLSTAAALLLPASAVGVPGWIYALLGPVMPLYGRAFDRRRPAVEPPPATADATPSGRASAR